MSSPLTSATPLHQFVAQSAQRSNYTTPAPFAQTSGLDSTQLLQLAIEELADGLMVITPQGDIVMANRSARQLCYYLASDSCTSPQTPATLQLPTAIWQQCQEFLQQGKLQLSQRAVPEFELMLDDSVHLRVRVRWLETAFTQAGGNQPAFLLLTLEELDRSVSKIQQYNLSDREQEVWKLRLQGYSYCEIANKLYITINTVKKHTKNIRAKQRLFEDTRMLSGLAESTLRLQNGGVQS